MMQGMPVRERKVLYLLHGLSDDASAWQRYSSIETYAKAYGLVVVMPSVGRSFYIDQPNGQHYFTYLIEELPRYLEDVFGIVPRRENTLIAGNSMGGYGAMKAALLHPERYFAAASFSGVLSLAIMSLLPPDDPRKAEFALLFGDLEKLPGSEHDPTVWLQRAVDARVTLPKLFVACGRQEDLYPLSLMFTEACRTLRGGGGLPRGGWPARLAVLGHADPALPHAGSWPGGAAMTPPLHLSIHVDRSQQGTYFTLPVPVARGHRVDRAELSVRPATGKRTGCGATARSPPGPKSTSSTWG